VYIPDSHIECDAQHTAVGSFDVWGSVTSTEYFVTTTFGHWFTPDQTNHALQGLRARVFQDS
jgi:hypothetical protein